VRRLDIISMRRYTFIVLIILLVIATYLTSFFIRRERFANESLKLVQENEDLRAQIQRYQASGARHVEEKNNYLTAKVFSTYPFNIKNQITVDIGENEGIRKNMVVILGENILIGQISEVFMNYSIAQTTFDPGFQTPVRIGQEEINGLFRGGNEPQVTLIEKEKQIQIGDVVYTAGQEYPYGLKIGEVTEINEISAGVFKEVFLKMPFSVNELREINVIK